MTDDELDKIEKTYPKFEKYDWRWSGAGADIVSLIAEVRRLKSDLAQYQNRIWTLENEVDQCKP